MAAPPLAFFSGPLPWVVLAVVTVVFLWVDLHFFARGREPSFREGLWWSIGWLVVSLLAAVVVLVLSNADDAITYTTVYFIERSLSLDNLFVFILLFAYFGVPEEHRARLLFWGIVAALVLRGLAIIGGRRADRAVPLRDLRPRRAAAGARLPDPQAASRRTSTRTATSSSGSCGGSSR